MEEILEQEKFKVVVPFNNEVMVKGRKNTKIIGGVSSLFMAALFIGITIWMGMNYGFSSFATWFFIVLGAIALGTAIYLFCTLKPNDKNNDATLVYSFYEDFLQIVKYKDENDEKPKMQVSCLYNEYGNKQYVAKLVEDETKLDIRIFTGTYNGAPQYSNNLLPKSVFEQEEEFVALKEFLSQKLGNKYKIKNK